MNQSTKLKKFLLAALILLLVLANGRPARAATEASSSFDDIYQYLVSSFPDQDTNGLAEAAGRIANQTRGITNQAALASRLNTLFGQSKLMTQEQSEKAATALAQTAAPAKTNLNLTNLPPFILSGPPPKNFSSELFTNDSVLSGQPSSVTSNLVQITWGNPSSSMIITQTNTPSLPYWTYFMSGAQFQNPYQIVVSGASNKTATLTNSGSRTVAVLEFNYINRFVLRDPSKFGSPKVEGPKFMGGHLQNPFAHLPDITANLGFAFDTGSSSSTYSASTLAGSGDFYSEGSMGLPLWRDQRQSLRQQVSFDFAGGIATDREFLAVHPNMIIGPGYQASFKSFFNPSNGLTGVFCSRVGVGWTDIPSLIDSDSKVAVDGEGDPEFKFRAAPALETFLAAPLTSAIYLTARANVFLESRPSSWNITVGATIPLASLQNVFKSFTSSSTQ